VRGLVWVLVICLWFLWLIDGGTGDIFLFGKVDLWVFVGWFLALWDNLGWGRFVICWLLGFVLWWKVRRGLFLGFSVVFR
jgi:hypothetical protein